MSKLDSVRPSVIAGSWYPGSAPSLSREVEGFLAHVDGPQVKGELLALISPHAGYAYSGQTAAYAYQQLRGLDVGTVVVMGPSHRPPVGDLAVSGEDAYETPLGTVQIDRTFVSDLTQRIPLHTIWQDMEHSLEIQLPFLQTVLDDFSLVPITIGTIELEVTDLLATALVEAIRQRREGKGRVLLVASSDLHHIHDYAQVVRRDKRVIDAVASYDLDALSALLLAPSCSVCGRMPILAALRAAKLLGADAAQILHYTNSGDVTGLRQLGQYTVGYLAAAVYKSQ